jgi:hypothetical protein
MMPATIRQTFSLTVFAQEWWIANNAVEGAFHLRRELDSFFEVIVNEFLEDSEAFVYFKKLDFWSALVFSRCLIKLAFITINLKIDSPSSFSTE